MTTPVLGDSTNVTKYFHLRLAADGTDATGLTITNIDLQYVRSGAAPSTKADATALAATDSAHTDNAAIEVDATDQPGVYRVDWPDAAFAAGVSEVILTVKCATVFTESMAVPIVAYNPADGVRLGLTALPNAAAGAAGGLPISDAGGLDLDALPTELAKVPKSDGTVSWNATALASINAQADAAIETYHLHHIFHTTYDPASKPGAADALLNELVESDGGVSRFTANALEEAPTGGSAPTAEEIRQEIDANSTQLAAIVADTNELQQDWEDGGRLDLILDGIGSSGLTPLASGTAQGGTASTIQLASAETFGDDILNGSICKILSGTGAGQSRMITDYTGATDTASVAPDWGTAPDATSVYEVVEGPCLYLTHLSPKFVSVTSVGSAAITSSSFSTSAITSTAIAANAITSTQIAANAIGANQLASSGIAEIQSGLSTLDAAGVRTALGMASANLDTQLADIPTVAEFNARTLAAADYFDPATDTVANVTTVGSVTTKTGYKLASDGLDLVLVDGKTLPAALQIIAAGVLGKVSGAGLGTEVFVGLDGATTRATVTVDASGNRSAVVYA